jgi:NIPSNAP
MLYHCIRYTIDRYRPDEFETYARRWMEGDIITRCGGKPLGYFLPKRGFGGPDNIALALIGFQSLAAYESYRSRIAADLDSKKNLADAEKSRCILIEDRSYFYRISENGAEE